MLFKVLATWYSGLLSSSRKNWNHRGSPEGSKSLGIKKELEAGWGTGDVDGNILKNNFLFSLN